jgi:hydroxymethylpyrimidine/phosphomethylpyrimidine kinase
MIKGRILCIAGSDSGGGAGIQADIKTITCLHGYAMTAITALTAQNTLGVHAVHAVPPEFLRQQLEVVASDIGMDAIKTGMLHDTETIKVVVEFLKAHPTIPVVVDPVMIAKGGAPLLLPEALHAMRTQLLPLASIITPNLPEAAALLGASITNMHDAAAALLALGCQAVYLKGGHGTGAVLQDVIKTADEILVLEAVRLDTRHTHGTGCTLAAALACSLGQGQDVLTAARRAHAFVQHALRHAPGFGGGHGALGHLH